MDAAVGGTAVQWLALLSHSKKCPRLNPMTGWGLSVRMHVPVWILSKFAGFLPQPKDMHVRLTGDSNLAPDANVSMKSCVLLLAL